jgi:hypothetical protein
VLQDLIPLKRMLDAGSRVACGSDWGPKNIFEHIALGTTHEFGGSGRRNDGPAMSPGRALACGPRGGARLGWRNRFACAGQPRRSAHRRSGHFRLEDLAATKVLFTVLGGERFSILIGSRSLRALAWDAGPGRRGIRRRR